MRIPTQLLAALALALPLSCYATEHEEASHSDRANSYCTENNIHPGCNAHNNDVHEQKHRSYDEMSLRQQRYKEDMAKHGNPANGYEK